MNKIILTILVLGIATFGGVILNKNIYGNQNSDGPEVSKTLTGNNLYKATLSIEGMYCASCAVGSEYSLKKIDGVADAYIGFTDDLDGEGWVIYDKDKVSNEQITKAIEPYTATIVSEASYTK